MKRNNQKGIVIIIYILIIALIATLIFVVGQSRLLLAIQQGKSSSDTIVASYQAETEISNLLTNLSRGKLTENDFGKYPQTKVVGGITLTITAIKDGNNQILTVTAKKGFSVSKIQAIRTLQNVLDAVEIALSLDCTGSMDDKANPNSSSTKSRFDAQKEAALKFVSNLIILNQDPNFTNKFKLGVMVFGIDAKWLKVGSQDITPESGITLENIKNIISQNMGSTRANSSACTQVMDATSVGSPLSKTRDYFQATKKSKVKQIEVMITDGEPNTRIPDSKCQPNVFCPGYTTDPLTNLSYCSPGGNEYGWQCYNYSSYAGNDELAQQTCVPLARDFLKCTLATTKQSIGTNKFGTRDPEVDAYTVTIFTQPPGDIKSIMTKYSTDYYNASEAGKLTGILDSVLADIKAKLSSTIVSRVIPIPQTQ